MLDIATATIKDQLVARVRRDVPYRDYFTKAIEAAFNVADRFEQERNRILADGRFSDEGKRAGVAALVQDTFAAELAFGPAKVARHAGQRNESRKSALGRPAFDKADLAAGLERREVRDYVRSQEPEVRRFQVAVEMLGDRKLAEAILSGPSPKLTGLNDQQFSELHRLFLKEHFAADLAEIDAEADDIRAVASAVEIARTKLQGASGVPAFKFDETWKALEEKADQQ